MATTADSASNVRICLSTGSPNRYAERQIMLDSENKSVTIGRASKSQAKGFVADSDNGWFESPVMSRTHAEITADLHERRVEIRDLGSLHGTYVNDDEERIQRKGVRELKDGDYIKFGVPISRGEEQFQPTKVKVGIEFDHRPRAGSTFRVPEGSDDGSEIDISSSEDDCAIKEETAATALTVVGVYANTPVNADIPPIPSRIDLTGSGSMDSSHLKSFHGEANRRVARREVIDLSSPPQSPAIMDDVEIDELDELDDSDSLFLGSPGATANIDDEIHRASSPEVVEGEQDAEDVASHHRLDDDAGAADAADAADAEADADDVSDFYEHEDFDQESIRLSSDEEDMQTDSESENEGDSVSGDEYRAGVRFSDEYDEDDDLSSLSDSHFDDYDVTGDNHWGDSLDNGSDNESSDVDNPTDPFWKFSPPDINWPQRGPALSSRVQPPFSYTDMREPRPLSPALASTENDVTSQELPKTAAPAPLNNDILTKFGIQHHYPEPITTATSSLHQASGPSAALAPRQPSPSDVILSKIGNAMEATAPKTGFVGLGYKTGKSEFFKARESNKASVSPQSAAKPRISSSVHALCNDDIPSGDHDVLTTTASRSQEDRILDQPLSSCNASRFAPSTGPQNPFSSVPDVAVFFNEAQYDRQSVANNHEDTPGMLRTHQLGEKLPSTRKTNDFLRRTHLRIPDIVEGCSADYGKGKRKAEEISKVSDEEERWAAVHKEAEANLTVPAAPVISSSPEPLHNDDVVAEQNSAPREPSPVSIEVEVENVEDVIVTVSKVEVPITSMERRSGERAPKRQRLRHIAERVGYAALGGVTAGAMIVGTLIYTAPTFG